jgi:multisubunit Na+/H+ antiporter MnhB subunit
MPTSLPAFDALLALLLVWLAGRLLVTRDLFKAVVLFMVFGLMLALAWVRLAAPDVALAEAAIGAGLTGALLLDTVFRLRGAAEPPLPRPSAGLIACAMLAAALGAMLVWSMLALPGGWFGLTREVAAAMPDSGVTNPVTAALLNFRGYDTLLEIAVLLLAVLGVWTLNAEPPPAVPAAGPVLEALLRILLPLLVVAAGYLLWAGAHAPGGAFQGAALLAAGGVLLHLARPFSFDTGWPVRLALTAGFAVFLIVALLLVLVGGGFLAYPPKHAGTWILAIEAAAMLSIALILVALFVGSARHTDRGRADAGPHDPPA